MNILLTTPFLVEKGGVSEHYRSLLPHLKNINDINISVLEVGRCESLSRFSHQLGDQIRFREVLSREKIDIVHINPSLDPKSLIRDSLFVIQSKARKHRVIVFFHGWQKNFQNILSKYKFLLKNTFFNVDAYIVLKKEHKAILESWGVKSPIFIGTTTVADELITGFDIEEKLKTFSSVKNYNILFLARIIKEKGVYEAIDTCSLLLEKKIPIELIVAGDGPELNKAKNYAKKKIGDNVTFKGYVQGEEKRNTFINNHIYLFPSYHGEGMPTSVLEAIAFGMPVVTRAVGGLIDFFEDEKMGFITESKDPNIFSDLITNLLDDRLLCRRISKYNHEYAVEHFLASKVAHRLYTVYKGIFKPGID